MSAKRVAGQPEGSGGDHRPAGAPAEDDPRREADAEQAAEVVGEDLEQLAEAKRERDEYLELAQRTRADFENYRKRVTTEAREALARGKAELARELIPAIDNLERALRSAGVDSASAGNDGEVGPPDGDHTAADAFAHGVALVYRELGQALQRAGVEAYDPAGEPFDPSLHEALSARAEEGAKSGVVLETVDRGYRLDGQILRPARVIVSE